jgi:hypothetical protein
VGEPESDSGLAFIYSTVIAAWIFLCARTALTSFFGELNDAIAAAIAVVEVAILFKAFFRLDRIAKLSASDVVNLRKIETSGKDPSPSGLGSCYSPRPPFGAVSGRSHSET